MLILNLQLLKRTEIKTHLQSRVPKLIFPVMRCFGFLIGGRAVVLAFSPSLFLYFKYFYNVSNGTLYFTPSNCFVVLSFLDSLSTSVSLDYYTGKCGAALIAFNSDIFVIIRSLLLPADYFLETAF